MKAMRAMVLMASVLSFLACDSGGDKAGGKASGDDGPKSESTAAAAASAVPVEEDFEEEAQKEIDADNLDSQVSALEKEINGD